MRYRKDGQPWGQMWDAWDAMQDARLVALAGTIPPREIVDTMSAEFGIPRTLASIRIRAKRLGVSVAEPGLSMRQMERLFNQDHRVIETWVAQGLLPGRRRPPMGPYPGWSFMLPDVERFIREESWAYDWRKMQLRHPLRALAESISRRDPWCSRDQLARYLGFTTPSSLTRWFDAGLIPHVRRKTRQSTVVQIVIRASDFPAIKEAIEAARIEGQKRKGWRRRLCSAEEQAA